MTPDEGNYPPEFRRSLDWTNWSSEVLDWTDAPKQPFFGRNKSTNWTDDEGSGSFFDAYDYTTRHPTWGVGPITREGDPFTAIDLDGCLDDYRNLKEWCPKPPWLTTNDWAEVSASGNGVHTAVKGVTLPWWWSNVQDEDKDHVGVDCFDGNRFIALTGDLWQGHGTTIPDVDQEEFTAWLKDVYRSVTGETPWEYEAPEKSSEPGETDVDIGIYDIISRARYPPGKRVSHPVHGSDSGTNFQVDDDGEPTWRCWRHEVTGTAHHLLGMEAGVFRCGEWETRNITPAEWTEAYDYGRKKGYDGIPPKKPQGMRYEEHMQRELEQRKERWQKEDAYWAERYHEMKPEPEAEPASEPEEPASASATSGVDPEETTPQDSIRADGGTPWDEIRELYQSSDKGTTSEASYQASELLIAQFNPKSIRRESTIYCYDSEVGHYVDDGRDRIKQTLRTNLGPEYNRTRMYEVLNHIESVNYIDRGELEPPEDRVCVQNGVLDLSDPENPELLEHSPEWPFTWKLDTPYDPDAVNRDFLDFLDETVREKDIPKLQEYAGEGLQHWEQSSNMMVLLGPTDAGKGTFLHVLQDVFGHENVAAESVGSLADSRWGVNSLYQRLLNIANELSTKRVDHQETVKNLSGGGDPMSAEEKGQPVYEFVPTANHLFAANQVPQVPDAGEAFYNRWLFVLFPETIPVEEQDRNLDDKLVGTDERRAGILNWLLKGYARGQSMGAEYTNEMAINGKESQWKSYGSSVERFIESCIDTESANSGDLIANRDVYEVYKMLCRETGKKTTVNQNELVEELKRLPGVGGKHPSAGVVDDKGATIFEDVMRPRCVQGVRLTDWGGDLYEQVYEENIEEDTVYEIEMEVEKFGGWTDE